MTLTISAERVLEEAIPFPDEACREGAAYENVLLSYTIAPNAASTRVTIYISCDTKTDNQRATADGGAAQAAPGPACAPPRGAFPPGAGSSAQRLGQAVGRVLVDGVV